MRDALMALFDGTITFGDRPDAPVALQSVFDRNSQAVELFRMYNRGDSLDSLTEDQKTLLDEAKLLFGNRFKLADGGAQYGILLNRRGTPTTDDNFVGAGRESANIAIKDVKIHGLHANPIEVPSLMTDEGAHMQGVARDLLRITDVSCQGRRPFAVSKAHILDCKRRL